MVLPHTSAARLSTATATLTLMSHRMCRASHPAYTHQQRKATSEGRIAGFNKRFAAFSAR
ncbi:50S ribosomal protein L31 [Pseudomonas sp. 008]|uniref:50S ribosomal protein L31 n=1 Tax=Pseudomonas sp. 008 TaxID=2803906 RepID=UPI0035B56BEF